MPKHTLDGSMFAFSVTDGFTAELEVLDGGPLAYSTQAGGPFAAEGELGKGQARAFDRSAIVSSSGRTEFDLTYPQPEPPEPSPASSELPWPPELSNEP